MMSADHPIPVTPPTGRPRNVCGMKAVVFDTFGDPEVLHLADVPRPDPGPG
jgi:hypothetical protein